MLHSDGFRIKDTKPESLDQKVPKTKFSWPPRELERARQAPPFLLIRVDNNPPEFSEIEMPLSGVEISPASPNLQDRLRQR